MFCGSVCVCVCVKCHRRMSCILSNIKYINLILCWKYYFPLQKLILHTVNLFKECQAFAHDVAHNIHIVVNQYLTNLQAGQKATLWVCVYIDGTLKKSTVLKYQHTAPFPRKIHLGKIFLAVRENTMRKYFGSRGYKRLRNTWKPTSGIVVKPSPEHSCTICSKIFIECLLCVWHHRGGNES